MSDTYKVDARDAVQVWNLKTGEVETITFHGSSPVSLEDFFGIDREAWQAFECRTQFNEAIYGIAEAERRLRDDAWKTVQEGIAASPKATTEPPPKPLTPRERMVQLVEEAVKACPPELNREAYRAAVLAWAEDIHATALATALDGESDGDWWLHLFRKLVTWARNGESPEYTAALAALNAKPPEGPWRYRGKR